MLMPSCYLDHYSVPLRFSYSLPSLWVQVFLTFHFLSPLFYLSIHLTRPPVRSVFKPFIFSDSYIPVVRVVSPQFGPDDPVRKQPRFQSQVDRRHDLYKAHEVALNTMETKPVGTYRRLRSLMVFPLISFIHHNSVSKTRSVFGDRLQLRTDTPKMQQDLTVSADKTHGVSAD